MNALGSVRRELDGLYQALETVTDEKLVDSVIYEIKSLEARYDYHFCNIKQMDSALRREAPQQIQDGKAAPGLPMHRENRLSFPIDLGIFRRDRAYS